MKSLGIACVGGGTKAASNIGVIKALLDNNISISAISGTSIGSIVAVMYALGFSTDEMIEKLKYYTVVYPKYGFKDKITAPFRLLARGGGKNPREITTTINNLLKDKEEKVMSDIKMPLFIPTLDITNKKTVYYSSKEINGEECYLDRPIAEAIKNTSSLPLIFTPNTVYINGEMHQFLDGGMTNNTPTTHLNKFADIVVGVENEYHKEVNSKKVNLVTGIRNTFQGMRRSAVTFQKKDANFWILVDCEDVDIIGTPDQITKCYEAGYNTAMKNIDELKKLLSE